MKCTNAALSLLAVAMLTGCSAPAPKIPDTGAGEKPIEQPIHLSQEATNALAMCGGGIGNKQAVGAKLIAEYDKLKSATLSAEASKNIETYAVQSKIFSDANQYKDFVACIKAEYVQKVYPTVSGLKVAPGSHRGSALAQKTAPHTYVLSNDLFAGSCAMLKGATLVFSDDGTATITAKVKSSSPSFFTGDYFHSYIADGDDLILGEVTSPDIRQPNTPIDFVASLGVIRPDPDKAKLVWIGDC